MSQLQDGVTNRLVSTKNGDGQYTGSLEIGVDTKGGVDTLTTNAFFKLPRLTTTQRTALTAEEGMQVYDTTIGEEYTYRAGGWGSSSGTAAGSLDAAYNGGTTIAVDGGAVTLTDTQTTTGGGLLITKSGVITGANNASVFHINSTGAHDTSGDVTFLEISVGAETISGAIYGIEIEMNANTDSGITITKGAMTLTDGAMTLTSGNFTMSSGNLDVTGTGAISGNATVGGTFDITGASTCAALTASGDVIIDGDGKSLIIDSDDAEALLIRTNGDAADVITVDTTGDAGDTTLLITPENTTGVGVHIDGSTITTGDVLKLTGVAATMTAAGALLSCVVDGTEVFAIRDDGAAFSIKGTAEGTAAVDVTTGDIDVEDGDLNVRGGETSLISNANATGLTVTNNTITTANQLVSVSSTSITTGALMTLNANAAAHDGEVLELISAGDATSTPVGMSVTIASPTTGAARGIEVTMVGATTTAKGIAVTMDALTTGDMLYLDNGGGTLTGDGKFINCNDDNVSAFSVSTGGATVIAGTAAGTAAMTLSLGDLVITDTDSTTITSVNGTGSIVEIISGGAIGAGKACLEIDAAGAFNATGSMLRLSGEGITATNSPVALDIDLAALDMTAINIVSAPTTNSAIVATTTGILAADKAILELVSNAAACNADSAVARFEQTATDGVANCLTLKQDDVSENFINFESTEGSGNAVDATQTTPGTVYGSIAIMINGVRKTVAVYDDDWS